MMESEDSEVKKIQDKDQKESSSQRYSNSARNSPTSKDGSKKSSSSGSLSNPTSGAEDEDEPVNALKDKGWLNEIEVPVSPPELQHEIDGQILPSANPSDFGDVCIKNSSNVHLGSRVFYKGPVTIKQFVYTNSASATDDEATGSLQHNPDDFRENNDIERKLSTNSTTSLQPFSVFSNPKVAEWFRTRRCILTVSIAASILVILNVLSIWFAGMTFWSKRPYASASFNDTSINHDPTFDAVHIVPRVEWGAQPPSEPPTPLRVVPAPYVIISHTASMFCYTQAQCVLNVRVAQTFHIESKGWGDIGYNFLVGGDGSVYEGRGWNVEGAHTFDYNSKSIGISFIGTFNEVKPTRAQIHAVQKLIELGVTLNKISKDYKLLGHRQCIKTESPGEALYNIIKTWDHWSPTP